MPTTATSLHLSVSSSSQTPQDTFNTPVTWWLVPLPPTTLILVDARNGVIEQPSATPSSLPPTDPHISSFVSTRWTSWTTARKLMIRWWEYTDFAASSTSKTWHSNVCPPRRQRSICGENMSWYEGGTFSTTTKPYGISSDHNLRDCRFQCKQLFALTAMNSTTSEDMQVELLVVSSKKEIA